VQWTQLCLAAATVLLFMTQTKVSRMRSGCFMQCDMLLVANAFYLHHKPLLCQENCTDLLTSTVIKTFPPLEIAVKSLQAHQHLWYLRFSQWCWWRFKSSRKWCCVVSHVLPKVLKDWVISSWTAWSWRWKHSDSLKAGNYLLNTASQPESLNMQSYTFQIWNQMLC